MVYPNCTRFLLYSRPAAESSISQQIIAQPVSDSPAEHVLMSLAAAAATDGEEDLGSTACPSGVKIYAGPGSDMPFSHPMPLLQADASSMYLRPPP
jgi:hypothetical protein